MKINLNSVLLFATLISTNLVISKPQLRFNSEGKFRIVQFTDIHIGEREDLDIRSLEVVRTVLEKERPEMVFFTGDAISGYGWDKKTSGWFKYQFGKLDAIMQEFNVPYAYTAGNHDTEGELNRT